MREPAVRSARQLNFPRLLALQGDQWRGTHSWGAENVEAKLGPLQVATRSVAYLGWALGGLGEDGNA